MPPKSSRAPDLGEGPALEVRGLYKSFGNNQVLHGVNLTIGHGEVVGLLGPNGAGKSTLIRTLVGDTPFEQGTIQISGVAIEGGLYSARRAAQLGIYCVYQELSLCANLSPAENFFLREAPADFRWRAIARDGAQQALEQVFPATGIDVTDPVDALTLAQKQMCEVAFAATNKALRVLILDEPTSALPRPRFNQLRQFLAQLRGRGVGIIYASHKLDEIQEVADRLVILRDGRNRWEGAAKAVSEEDLIELLGGQRHIVEAKLHPFDPARQSLLDGTTQGRRKVPGDIRVFRGEIVGLAGLEGAGQRQVLQDLYKTSRPRRGTTMAYVSGDRQAEGIFRLWTIADNIIISGISRLSRHGIVDADAVQGTVRSWFDRFKFEASSPNAPITQLSGGHQQKALVARAMASESELLLLDDPTRGVDVSTKEQIYESLNEIRTRNRSALLYSSEDAELQQCDRVYVMRGGNVVAELTGRDEILPETIIHWSYQDTNNNTRNTGSVEQPTDESGRKTSLAFSKAIPPRMLVPILLFAGIVIFNGITQPDSVSSTGLDLLVGAALPLVLATLAQTFILIAGDIDLGIGNALGLGNVLAATLLVRDPLLGLLSLILLIAAYAAMAWIIHVRRIPSIVMTLGASFIWLGIALVIQPTPGGTAPLWLTNMTSLSLPGIPEPVYIVVLVALAGYWLLRRLRYGVVLRGFGNNPLALTHTGWSSLRARITLYVLAGTCVVIGALLITAASSGSDANGATTYTLTSIAAAIVGGAEFSGGIGESIGVVVGALAFSFIVSLLGFLSISSAYETAVTGLILLATLAFRPLLRGRTAS